MARENAVLRDLLGIGFSSQDAFAKAVKDLEIAEKAAHQSSSSNSYRCTEPANQKLQNQNDELETSTLSEATVIEDTNDSRELTEDDHEHRDSNHTEK